MKPGGFSGETFRALGEICTNERGLVTAVSSQSFYCNNYLNLQSKKFRDEFHHHQMLLLRS
jgi:hypothetical protein